MSSVDQQVAQLQAAVDALVEVSADELDDDTLRAITRAEHRAKRRLEAHRTELVAARARRSAERVRIERPGDARAPERAAHDVQKDYADDLQIDPSQAKRGLKAGRQLETLPRVRRLFREGRITRRHVELLADTLAPFTGARRGRLEARLCQAAVDEAPVVFGRTCRRLLAEEDADAAMRRLNAQNANRRAAITQTPAGTTVISGEGVGVDAEIVHTAIDAFRRPDAADERRSPDQRTWDALVDVCSAALRAGEAPDNHQMIPHVSVLIDDTTLREQHGAGECEHTGPLPYRELVGVLGDSRYAAILAGADGLPLQVFHQTRYVPVGLYKALRLRDTTCIWPGCDLPGRWCDVAHFDVPYAKQGKLSLEGAGLLCRRHHRRFDHGPYVVRFVDRLPVICRSDGSPLVAGSAPPGPTRAGPPSVPASGSPERVERPPPDPSAEPGPGPVEEPVRALDEPAPAPHGEAARGVSPLRLFGSEEARNTSAESRGVYDAVPWRGPVSLRSPGREGSSVPGEQRVYAVDATAPQLLVVVEHGASVKGSWRS